MRARTFSFLLVIAALFLGSQNLFAQDSNDYKLSSKSSPNVPPEMSTVLRMSKPSPNVPPVMVTSLPSSASKSLPTAPPREDDGAAIFGVEKPVKGTARDVDGTVSDVEKSTKGTAGDVDHTAIIGAE